MGSVVEVGAGGRGLSLCGATCAQFLLLLFLSSLQVVLGGRLVRLRPRDTRDSHRERCRKFVFAPDCRGIQSKRSGGGGPFLLKMYDPTKRHYLGVGAANLFPARALRPNFRRFQGQPPITELGEAGTILSF